MSGSERRPFQRNGVWCGDLFTARRESDKSCCLECSEELYQHLQELQIAKAEFRSVREKVEVLHERLYRLHLRIDRLVKRLQVLGVQWQQCESDQDWEKVERRERLTAKTLERLNLLCEEAIPAERKLSKLERELANLKRIIGEDSPMDD